MDTETETVTAEAEPTPAAEAREPVKTEREDRQVERFLFVFALVILLDIIVFDALGGVFLPLLIVVLEVAFLAVLARVMGIQEIGDLVRRMTQWAKGLSNRGSKTA